jgi:hypothetical protein
VFIVRETAVLAAEPDTVNAAVAVPVSETVLVPSTVLSTGSSSLMT